MELSNNRAERSVKAISSWAGRAGSFQLAPAGAMISAVIHSLIESKGERLDPYRYLVWLLNHAPWPGP